MPARPRRPASSTLSRRHSAARATRSIGRLDVADYISAIAGDLQALAHSADLPTLAYLLDMARVEAEIQLEILSARDGTQDNATRPAESL